MSFDWNTVKLVFLVSVFALINAQASPINAQQPNTDHCKQYSKIIELIVNDSMNERYHFGEKPYVIDSVKNLSNFMSGRLMPWAAFYSIQQNRELDEVSGAEIIDYVKKHSPELLNNNLFQFNCTFSSFSAPSCKIQFYRLNDYCVLANAFVSSDINSNVKHSFGRYYFVQFTANNSYKYRQWSWQE